MSHRVRSYLLLPAVVLAAAVLDSTPSPACSVCRCGDATFNALGKNGYTSPGLRFALDWERFDRSQGVADAAETQVENRTTLFFSYGAGDRFQVSVRLPYSHRKLTAEGEALNASGFSNPEVYGQVRLWASPGSDSGRRASVSLTAGVQAPWGQNSVTQDGNRLPEHVQPGTGAADLFGSVSGLYLVDSRSALFGSVGYRHTGTNDHDYRYGKAALANLAYQRTLGHSLDGVLELNFRHAAKDRIDAARTKDQDTGGSLLYLTPRLLWDLGGGVVFRAAVQVPTIRKLNGEQTERVVINAGFTWIL